MVESQARSSPQTSGAQASALRSLRCGADAPGARAPRLDGLEIVCGVGDAAGQGQRRTQRKKGREKQKQRRRSPSLSSPPMPE